MRLPSRGGLRHLGSMPKEISALHVAVLMGGLSAERTVSLTSGGACAAAAERLGHRVTRIDAGRDLAQQLTAVAPDVVLNCLHGTFGEDGCVQGILETLQIPYTHSGVLASALAMDKTRAKIVLAAAGVPVPQGGLFTRRAIAAGHVLPPPYIVKPNAEGSSVGVIRVLDVTNRPPAAVLDGDADPDSLLLVEPFIPGRELTVAVLGEKDGARALPRALAVTEITVKSGFYDYDNKYSDGGSLHTVPADLPPDVTERALRLAERAHTALGCRGVTRTDFRYDENGAGLVALELNTQPGMTPLSLAPEQAAHVGMGFDGLVQWMIGDASYGR